MSIVPRPIKVTSGTKDFAPNTDILANEVNDDLNLLYDEVMGGLDSSNLSPTAGIQGTQCASKPSGMSAANINAGAIGNTELATQAVASDNMKSTNGLIHTVLATLPAMAANDTVYSVAAVPSVAYPKATYDLIGLYLKNINPAGMAASFWCVANDTGANWEATFFGMKNGGASGGTPTIQVVFIFVEKT